MKYFFVCKKFEPEKGQYFGDLIPIDSMMSSTSDKRVAEKVALRQFLESAGKEEFYVLEAKLVYQPAIKNIISDDSDEDSEPSPPVSRPQAPLRKKEGT